MQGSFVSSSRLSAILAAGLMLLAATAASAFEVKPLLHDLAPFGRDATSTVDITNPTDRPLPIEITINRRRFDDDNEETLTPADDDFLIFPPATVVEPGKTQRVRLQWLGEPELATSQSYYARIAQVPITESGDEGNEIQLVLAFNIAVHVSPEHAEADIRSTGSSLGRDAEGKPILLAKLENHGSGYAYASQLALTLTSPTASLALGPDDILTAKLNMLLPPGEVRTMRIPLETGNWSEPVEVALELADRAR
ncbi:MAG: fimbrial biogenesis chaperone [Geminicoccaceae bacterium]